MKKADDKDDGKSSQVTPAVDSMGGLGGTTGNIDKIRDILFGAQMKEFNKRFSHLESRMVKELSDLRDETKRQLESLENYAKNEIESVLRKLKNEGKDREDEDGKLRSKLGETAAALEKKLNDLDESTSQAQRDQRQQLLDQSKSLRDEIHRRCEELMASLERTGSELRSDKVDRAALANMFTEVAMRLHNDSALSFDLNLNKLSDE
ncbi:hypothetical protein JW905_18775 [bacterium]|nr:hypothetical protein [candidate division CSSED10-310 bacterium]